MVSIGSTRPKERHSRSSEGWEFGRIVVEYLSSRRRDPGREHVTQLLRAVSKIQDESTPLRNVRSLAKTVQHLLQRYVQRPVCFLGESRGRGFLVFDVFPDGKGTPGEYRAVNALIRLTELGLVGRLHHCHSNGCRRWLYGKKYCDADCRRTHERSTRSFREYQRKKQAEYYERKKELAIKYRQTGKSLRAIADRLQTTPQRIEYWLRQAAPKDSSQRFRAGTLTGGCDIL